MIAKKIALKSGVTSSFKRLAEYITSSQGKQERVEGYVITNCQNPDSMGWAVKEIESVQAMNKRANSDKTYHLLVSFAPGEYVSNEALAEIERRMCDSLGYGEHQRISAIHADTDNLHMHITINKIHPTTFNLQEPYRDYKTLSALCAQIEQEYGLQRTNRDVNKVLSENHAQDMERFSGIESLLGWIKRECLTDLQNASTWAEFHETLAKNGLQMQERGNGFVIVDKEGLAVKASSVARDFSKPKLIKRFGQQKAAGNSKAIQPEKQYKKTPLKTRVDTTLLYASYKRQMELHRKGQVERRANLRSDKQQKILAAKKLAAAERAVVKLTLKGLPRKMAYLLISKQLRGKLDAIARESKAQQVNINTSHKALTWLDWLREQAVQGNEQASLVLRERKVDGYKSAGNAIKGQGDKQQSGAMAPAIDSVTRQGTIIYADNTAIRDTGKKINVTRKTDANSLVRALSLAVERYGKNLHIEGDLLFKQQVVSVAAANRLDITFDDAAMELHKQQLINRQIRKEQNAKRNRDGTGRSHRESGAGAKLHGKSNIAEVGREPPPSRRDGLYNLPQRSLVQPERGGQVLLPSHVHGQLDKPGAERDSALRREISRVDQGAAVNKFVAEREQKRSNGFDILKHMPYNNSIDGAVKLAGVRSVDGVSIGLFEKNNTVYVKEISQKEAGRLKSVSKNSPVQLNQDGSIKVSTGKARKT